MSVCYPRDVERAELEQRLRRFLATSACAPDVIAAYLYGSRARGTARSDSDVDLAVLLEGPEPVLYPDRALLIQCELERWLELPLQVVALNAAPADLIHRVLRDGQIVHDRDRAQRLAFEVRARNQYFDLLPILKEYRRPRSLR